jgi:hypothetical protein
MSTANTYKGSCHCGDIQYQVKLTFPPEKDVDTAYDSKSLRLYKCNCRTCQKMGLFHCRPTDPGNNFILTSPSTIEQLGDYRTGPGRNGWYFCKKCGVRVFGLGGQWEPVELDVDKWVGKDGGDGKSRKVWVTRPKDITTVVDGKEVTKPFHYLSVNAVTLDVGEGGVDLKEWHEKGWIFYVENYKSGVGLRQPDRPFPCGMY